MLKKEILRNKDDFSKIYNKGKSIGGRYIVLFYKRNNLSYNRTAFLASKKVGNSVVRNRARRLMKESYRFIRDDIDKGYDLIFIARKTMVGRKFCDIYKSMNGVVRKAKLYKGSRGDIR